MTAVWTETCEDVARNAVKGFFAPGLERDDLLQEARIGVCDAQRRYRAREGMEFAPFAYYCARRRVMSAVKAATRKKHARLNEALSFDTPVRTPGDSAALLGDLIASGRADPAEHAIAREEAARIAAAMLTLSELEHTALVRCAIAGEPYHAVGDGKSVDNAMQRARRKLAVAA